MKKILILFVLISQAASSQVNNQKFWNYQDAMARDVSPEISALGSPYIQKEFSPVRLDRFKNKVFNARFNAYTGEMQIETEEKTIALDPSAEYKLTFLSKNKVYQTYSYISKNGQTNRGFLVVISSSEKAKLLKKENIDFQEKKAAVTSYDKEKPATFIRGRDSYFIELNNEVVYLPSRKKDLLKAFSENSNEIKKYLKAQRISLGDEEDLTKLVQYISTL